jgi:hypothetical protein
MTEPHAAAHAPGTPLFSDAEWQDFRRSDMAMGRTIVVLMAAIFSIGLVLYAAIAIIAASG